MRLTSLIFLMIWIGSCSLDLNAQIPSQTPVTETAVQVGNTLTSVVVEKINGDRLTGLFIGADENALKLKMSGTVLNILLSEISTMRVVQETKPPDPILVKGRAISLPRPDYPKEAEKLKASGIVKVNLTIDESGRVTSARAVSGDPIFFPASETAAMQAKFEPSTLGGKPIAITAAVEFKFSYKR